METPSKSSLVEGRGGGRGTTALEREGKGERTFLKGKGVRKIMQE